MSYSLKNKEDHGKAVVSVRKPKGSSMLNIKLAKATQEQLGILFKMKHPFVVEDKKVVK